MNVALRKVWTQEAFFAWAERQERRYEFDGFQPVAMTGGNANHNVISINILTALSARLRGQPCRPFGLDAGVETVGRAVRYPDALVTCSAFKGMDRLIPGVVVVFEVISPSSGKVDRIIKLREYAAVETILRYVIVESTTMGLQVFSRTNGTHSWTAAPVTKDEVLAMPEIGVELPMDEIYEGIDLPPEPPDDGR
jgi:Uma2 family endonuclease